MGNFTSNTIQVADKYKNCNIPLGQGSYGHVDKFKEKEDKHGLHLLFWSNNICCISEQVNE